MDYNNHIMRSYVFIQHANPIASIPMNALCIIGFTISMPHIPPNRTTSHPVMDNAIRMGIKPPTANERNNEVAARHGFASLTPAARSASRCVAMLEYSPPVMLNAPAINALKPAVNNADGTTAAIPTSKPEMLTMSSFAVRTDARNAFIPLLSILSD